MGDGFAQGPPAEEGQRLLWADDADKPVAVAAPLGKGEIVLALLRVQERLGLDGGVYDPVAERLPLNMLAG